MHTRSDCRICHSTNIEKYLDFGEMPLAGGFLTKEQLKEEQLFPLNVYYCKNCTASEVLDIVPREILFKQYFYMSSATKTLSEHFERFAKEIKEKYLKNRRGLVLEIGSNDGILLKPLMDLGVNALGVDPALNVVRIAEEKGCRVVKEFFTPEVAEKISKKEGQAEIITASNVFAHVDDMDELMKAIKIMLAEEGTFVIEVHYVLDLVKKMQYDTIYHEHFSYYTVKSLQRLFERYGMEIFKVERIPIHAGSIRVFSRNKRKRNKAIERQVKALLEEEKKAGLHSFNAYVEFAEKVKKQKNQLNSILSKLKKEGKKIVGYGAAGRGNTLLNYCKIGRETLDYVVDASPLRQNKFIPGMHIPIVAPEKMRESPPDYALLLAWSYFNEVMKKEQEFLKKGGKFVIPLPRPRIIGVKDLQA